MRRILIGFRAGNNYFILIATTLTIYFHLYSYTAYPQGCRYHPLLLNNSSLLLKTLYVLPNKLVSFMAIGCDMAERFKTTNTLSFPFSLTNAYMALSLPTVTFLNDASAERAAFLFRRSSRVL